MIFYHKPYIFSHTYNDALINNLYASGAPATLHSNLPGIAVNQSGISLVYIPPCDEIVDEICSHPNSRNGYYVLITLIENYNLKYITKLRTFIA